jgi:hypothetical protein
MGRSREDDDENEDDKKPREIHRFSRVVAQRTLRKDGFEQEETEVKDLQPLARIPIILC